MNKLPALLLAAAFASAAAAESLPDFDGMDANRDGKVSAAEHAAATKKMFSAMDGDRDGKVTATEMDAAYTKVTGKKASPKDMSAADKIKAVDTNGDGILTAAEHAAGARTMFGKMDANKDGYLSREEWTVGHEALMQRAAK